MAGLVGQLQISSVVGGAIVLLTTILRLFFRRHRLWWDDACALISMLLFIIHVTGIFIDTADPTGKSNPTKIASYYLAASTFYGVIWFARLSMLFSIIRIDHRARQRKHLLFVAAIFALAGTLLIGQVFWVCGPNPAWRKPSIPQCPLGTQVVICQLISDIASDCILMGVPLKLFRDILDKGLRRRLMLIFSASITITIVSSIHVAYILTGEKIKNLIAANAEALVSLIVCNLPVLVIATIRIRETTPKHDDGLGTSRISMEGIETIVTLSNDSDC